MKNDKSIGYNVITIVILIITQVIIRSIGIENVSVQVFVSLLVVGCSLVIFGIYKDGEKGLGIRYNTIIAILAVVASISMGATMIFFRNYPNLIDKYGKLPLIVSLSSYFALVLFIIIYRIVYKSKRK